MTSDKKMWFDRVEMLLKTLSYAKTAAMNIEAMCNTFADLCNAAANFNNKLKLCTEVEDFLRMYMSHELPYAIFELQSAETFESFVVSGRSHTFYRKRIKNERNNFINDSKLSGKKDKRNSRSLK